MQRTELEANSRANRRHGARVRAVTRDHTRAGTSERWRLVRLALAILPALAAAFWIAGARAEDKSPAAQGTTPLQGAAPGTIAPGALAPNSGAPEAAAPAAPQAPTGGMAGKADAVDKGASSNAGDSTDEDAAALPEPEDGQPMRGAAGPAPAPRGPSAYTGLATVLPSPAEAGHIDEVELPRRPVAVLSGRSTWGEGFKSLFDSFDVLASELARAGLKPAGRPMAVFVSTDEAGFSFEAMAPLSAAPADPSKVGGGVRFDLAPGGKAIRFTHKAPYEEIDTTYEAITAYLDSKNIDADDAFIEEYVTDPKDPSDATLQINIYVQPRKDAKAGGISGGSPENGPGNVPESRQGAGSGKAKPENGKTPE